MQFRKEMPWQLYKSTRSVYISSTTVILSTSEGKSLLGSLLKCRFQGPDCININSSAEDLGTFSTGDLKITVQLTEKTNTEIYKSWQERMRNCVNDDVLLCFTDGSVSKEFKCNAGNTGDRGFNPWVGKSPWRKKWQPIPVLLPGKSIGQRSQAG